MEALFPGIPPFFAWQRESNRDNPRNSNRQKREFSHDARKYVQNRKFAFMFHCFRISLNRRRTNGPGTHGIRYTAVMQNSLDYLDLPSNPTVPRLSTRQSYIKKSREKLLDHLGLDWDIRVDESYTEKSLKPYKRDWVYFQSYWFWIIVLLIKKIINESQTADDRLVAIRKCVNPLGLALRLVRVETPDDKLQDQNILWFMIDKLMSCPEDSDLVADVMKMFSESEVRRYLFYLFDGRKIEFVLRNSQKAGYSLWGIFPSVYTESKKSSPVSEYYIKHNVETISIILKYGGNLAKAAFIVLRPNFGGNIMTNQASDVTYLAPFRLNWVKRSRRENLMNQIVFFAKMSAEKKMDPEQARICLQLIWRSLPDAYPTRVELSEHMDTTCEWMEKLARTYSPTVTMVCDFFEENVSYKALDLPQPRYLKHYSRCTVRRIICECGDMIEGISSLKFRKLLLNYINLES